MNTIIRSPTSQFFGGGISFDLDTCYQHARNISMDIISTLPRAYKGKRGFFSQEVIPSSLKVIDLQTQLTHLDEVVQLLENKLGKQQSQQLLTDVVYMFSTRSKPTDVHERRINVRGAQKGIISRLQHPTMAYLALKVQENLSHEIS
ncbi:hypothetical protein RND71_039642 [Anisodus tanguticus]|uniref:Uncharacterized protein n=1 Tax=Anisodus tanguticus TaxID=243964 RepID=A0AAE1UVI9_9SOLA|nr:hypothetical protein RND71_039642 [Anisodus tanguticus]